MGSGACPVRMRSASISDRGQQGMKVQGQSSLAVSAAVSARPEVLLTP